MYYSYYIYSKRGEIDLNLTQKRKLIVNADDFGLSPGVNYGIIETFNYGILSSTTLMINQPYVEHALELSKRFPELSMGIHLTFDKGKALTNVSSLTDSNGNFLKYAELANIGKEVDFYQEAEAQLKLFIQLTGKKPTHVDSHHHIHLEFLEANKAILKLCKTYNLDYRKKEEMSDAFYNKNICLETIYKILAEKKSERIEIMSHPAYVDKELCSTSSYNEKRAIELEILKDKELKEFISKNFTLVNYLNIKKSNN